LTQVHHLRFFVKVGNIGYIGPNHIPKEVIAQASRHQGSQAAKEGPTNYNSDTTLHVLKVHLPV